MHTVLFSEVIRLSAVPVGEPRPNLCTSPSPLSLLCRVCETNPRVRKAMSTSHFLEMHIILLFVGHVCKMASPGLTVCFSSSPCLLRCNVLVSCLRSSPNIFSFSLVVVPVDGRFFSVVPEIVPSI